MPLTDPGPLEWDTTIQWDRLETREQRVGRAVEMLREGRRSPR